MLLGEQCRQEAKKRRPERYLIVCYGQVGATALTYDKEAMKSDLIEPVRTLLGKGNIDRVVVVTATGPDREGVGKVHDEDGSEKELSLTQLAAFEALQGTPLWDQVVFKTVYPWEIPPGGTVERFAVDKAAPPGASIEGVISL